jgi:ABC-2 type transport system ATP-binding protein
MTDHSPAGPLAPVREARGTSRQPVIEGTAVTRRFGRVTALDGATFRIEPGITGLLGANGAGKTTLLGLVLGLHHPDGGSLRVLGLDPSTAGPEVRARIGYSPEHHLLPPDTRAHDLVRHIAEVHGLPHREATSRASDALWQVGLGEERFRPVGTMSTGQRQRVKLAQAIAHDPALVLLDEPTDGLDPVQRDDMLALIRRVGSEFGIHVVISSHLLEEVERICDAAVILREGRVVASGPLAQLVGQGRGLLLEVDGRTEIVADRLRARGLSVEIDGSRLTVTRPADDDEALPHAALDVHDAARDAVIEAGVGIRRLTDRTVRLEDVFLEVGA